MKKLAFFLAASASLLAIPASAATFVFTLGGTYAGAGTLTATLTSGTSYAITGITGTFAGSTITGINTYIGADNVLKYPTTPSLDIDGFSFTTTANTQGVNVYYSSSGYHYYIGGAISAATFTVAPAAAGAVPEPASWAMMLGGFGLAGAAMRRRATTVRFAQAI